MQDLTPKPIPLIRAAGSHAEVGAQIGAATADAVRRAVGEPFDAAVVEAYRAVTLEHLPWIVDELEAVGEAAGVDPLAVFAASIEELQPAEEPVRCTDLLLTREGRVLVGHNNDLYAREEEDVVAIEWRVPGEPVVFTLGTGPWISVGWNDAGLSVTGNEVAPNDEQVGIPRLLQVRDVLTRQTLDDAVEAILHPARASSYNWVLADASGRALNVEGSATSACSWEPSEKATLAHTNHYVHEEMVALERTSTDGSRSRLRRAEELLGGREEPATTVWLRDALSDHEGAPDSLCRHRDADGIKTVFWCIADVTAGEIVYGRGNPCSSEAQAYRFET